MKDNRYIDFVNNTYEEAVAKFSGARLFGEPIDVKSYKEVITVLYLLYLNKELMHKDTDL